STNDAAPVIYDVITNLLGLLGTRPALLNQRRRPHRTRHLPPRRSQLEFDSYPTWPLKSLMPIWPRTSTPCGTRFCADFCCMLWTLLRVPVPSVLFFSDLSRLGLSSPTFYNSVIEVVISRYHKLTGHGWACPERFWLIMLVSTISSLFRYCSLIH
ncbi:hypothetical protein BJV77DRAFT_971598, partial [Russula vinacea]